MGKRYYCDYCDRSFIDDLEARKKHLNGSMHLRLRKEHYDSVRDSKTLIIEESAKEPCKRFLRNGECVFGSNCRFTHYTAQSLMELQQKIDEYEREEEEKELKAITAKDPASIVAAWLKQRGNLQIPLEDAPQEQLWELPPELQSRADLPPSLQPITSNSISTSEFEEWA